MFIILWPSITNETIQLRPLTNLGCDQFTYSETSEQQFCYISGPREERSVDHVVVFTVASKRLSKLLLYHNTKRCCQSINVDKEPSCTTGSFWHPSSRWECLVLSFSTWIILVLIQFLVSHIYVHDCLELLVDHSHTNSFPRFDRHTYMHDCLE